MQQMIWGEKSHDKLIKRYALIGNNTSHPLTHSLR
jgi:hypothetical protein